jgi:hypothetical protein
LRDQPQGVDPSHVPPGAPLGLVGAGRLVADGGHDDDRVGDIGGPEGGVGGTAGALVVGEDVAGLEGIWCWGPPRQAWARTTTGTSGRMRAAGRGHGLPGPGPFEAGARPASSMTGWPPTAEVTPLKRITRGALLRIAGTRGRPSRRGGSAVPQPERGQHQARKCYQRAG